MRKIVSRNNFEFRNSIISYPSDQKPVDIDTSVSTAIKEGQTQSSNNMIYSNSDEPVSIYQRPLTERAFDPILTHYEQKMENARKTESNSNDSQVNVTNSIINNVTSNVEQKQE